MVKINVLVIKKEVCEMIGFVFVICLDKIGILIENRMIVEVVYVDGRYIESLEEEINSYFEENCMINFIVDVEYNDGDIKYLGSVIECVLFLYYKNVDYR